MIVYGTRDVGQDAVGSTVDLEDQESLELAGGEILQVVSELTFRGFEQRVPPALHPTHPPLAMMFFYRASESPFGAFSMAQVRVSALAGLARFSYPVRGWIDNADAGSYFARRWGYRLDDADIDLQRRYDTVTGSVTVAGNLVLEVGLHDPDPVSGKDANHASHLNVAFVNEEGSEVPRLVQAGPQLGFRTCDRGRPYVSVFDRDAIGCDAPAWNVSAFTGQCDFLFSPVQFVCDPNLPALEGAFTLMGGLHAVGQSG